MLQIPKGKTLKDLLDEKSNQLEDSGLIHKGWIHYIQQEMEDDNFTLKTAIYAVVEAVPDIFPIDLPEQVEKNPEMKLNEKQVKWFSTINKGLIIPVFGEDVLNIISKAREYLERE